ncbi:hypothetical protein HFO33_36060 [Rhizobium leguminosarum]|uniref:hypothetical protein n=1 Tax=Rhizobium leguminosarum TaxID=384 RepID=UPI001C953C29|nr:hypothetical protein [Rhizobium leguminosarum]MBY5721891.1 hypothetical protein [Rhizobium leguminosarum]
MRHDEIPAFVEAVIAMGCDICAVDNDMYVFRDADLSRRELVEASPKIRVVDEKFGDRDFLKHEIVAHLRSLGRYVDNGATGSWRDNLAASANGGDQ